MPEGQDKVLEAFEALLKALKKALKVSEAFKALQKALKKALKEEQERLNDPTVAKLFRMLGNERLRLVEWLLSEVQRLAAIWRKGKAPDRAKPRKGKRRGKGRRRRTRKRGGPQSFYPSVHPKGIGSTEREGASQRCFGVGLPNGQTAFVTR
jgi:hypothetical protein